MSEIIVFVEDSHQRTYLTKRVKSRQVELRFSDERSEFAFVRNGFHANLAYLRHPHNPRLLIPLNEYGDFVLQEKYNEVLRVLTMLGASTITCKSSRTRGRRLGMHAKVLPFGLSGGQNRTQASNFDYSTEGEGGLPMDPRPLRWPDEPGIEAAIESVFRNRARAVDITVSRDQGITIDTKLFGRFKGLGIDMGVESTNSSVDVLTFTATFPERDTNGRLVSAPGRRKR